MRHFLLAAVLFGSGVTLRAEPDMYMNVYVVPPQLLNISAERTAKTILEQAGISFLPGSSAEYKAEKSQLIVRNTEEQMELVEAYIEALKSVIEKQIFVAIFEVSFQGELEDILKAKATEPEIAETAPVDEKLIGLFQFSNSEDLAMKEGGEIYFGSLDYFGAELARPPHTGSEGKNERQIRLAGIFTDAEAQLMLRRLTSLRGAGLVKLPNLTMISGQAAMSSLGIRRYGIEAVLGADESTTDLAIYLPAHGKALNLNTSGKVAETARVTIPDGDMAILAERTSDGNNRLVFVRSLILRKTDDATAAADKKISREDLADKSSQAGATSLNADEKTGVMHADVLAESATDLLIAGDFSGAAEQFAKAINLLPANDFAAPRRKAYEKQLLRAQQGSAK